MTETIYELNINSDNKNLLLIPNDKVTILKCKGYSDITELDLSLFPNLKKLTCFNNKVSVINLSTSNYVKKLNLFDNILSSINTSTCVNLSNLNIACSLLDRLDVSSCPNLRKLNTDFCENLTEIIFHFQANLKYLFCNNNKLTSLNLKSCTNLEEFSCTNNNLTELDLSNCYKLREIWCHDNKLKILKLNFQANITILHAYNNQLTTLPITLYQLRNSIKSLYLYGNNIIYTLNQVELIESLNLSSLNLGELNTGIINDDQNIHDINITLSMCESFEKILSNIEYDKCSDVLKLVLEDDFLNDKVKTLLVEYCSDTSIHSLLNVNFIQALSYIYPLHDDDTIKNLENEMLDSECMCFTGRMFRLINSLNGVIDEVKVNISLNQDLNNMANIISFTNLEHKQDLFLKNVFDKYPDISEDYLTPWLNNL